MVYGYFCYILDLSKVYGYFCYILDLSKVKGLNNEVPIFLLA